jgi:hypothetical protein
MLKNAPHERSAVGKHAFDFINFRFANESRFPQVSFPLGTLRFEQMALPPVRFLYFAVLRNLETLFGAAVCFQFRHIFLSLTFISL